MAFAAWLANSRLTTQSTYLIGRALGHDLVHSIAKAQAVIGQDTRESSHWIADRVAEGLAAVGVDVHSAGVITTPGRGLPRALARNGRRYRGFRVAQSLDRQRHQGFLRRRIQVD